MSWATSRTAWPDAKPFALRSTRGRWADRIRGGKIVADRGCRGRALRVPPTTRARAVSLDVVADVVAPAHRVHAAREEIEGEVIPNLPGNIVIGAGRVAAHAHGTDQLACRIVQGDPTAEHVDPSDALADHEVLISAVVIGIAAV